MVTSVRQVPSNHPCLRALHKATFPADAEPEWGAGTWWIVQTDGVFVAFSGIQRSRQWSDAGYLVRAGVLPRARGQGLQRRLVRAREHFAKQQGWRWLVTATLGNPASANTLIASGFRLYEPTTPWLAEGALYWRKRI